MEKALIVGSGGREHAIGWKLEQEGVSVFYAPGNGGTSENGINLHIDGANKNNFPTLRRFVKDAKVDAVIVGPEVPLSEGIVDYFNNSGYDRIFGPTKEATLLESDKFFSYDLMDLASVPQANSRKCESFEKAREAVEELSTPQGVVLKARGLTGGKGVKVYDSSKDALSDLQNFQRMYGNHTLVSERLFGEEFSVFGSSDGEHVSTIEISFQDHKPLLEGDKGPNTGGMGAYGPAPVAPPSVVRDVAKRMMTPVVQEMKSIGCDYRGFLYAGMMMTCDGPKVLEFNARFGDPEAQPAMTLIKNLKQLISSSLDKNLKNYKVETLPGAALCIVLASQGYPDSSEVKRNLGLKISGLEEAVRNPNIMVFHAGTRKEGDDVLTSGGRVLGVTAYSPEGIVYAQKGAYEAASKITIPGGFAFRKDIGAKAL